MRSDIVTSLLANSQRGPCAVLKLSIEHTKTLYGVPGVTSERATTRSTRRDIDLTENDGAII